jgi:ATP-dependent DNA ligase
MLRPPLPPMEAESVASLPRGEDWVYEPKWDGFRCLVFREADSVELQSKAGQPLARYFPEIVARVLSVPGERFVWDGELVVPDASGDLDFDALLQRIHPAESRIRKLAAETPAELILFDLLAGEDGRPLLAVPLAERRKLLERFAEKRLRKIDGVRLSPQTGDRTEAERWLRGAGGDLDGVVAKRADAPYASGERAFRKVKRLRTADCVVGGFRYGQGSKLVGSLLLGLYDDAGLLHHVGFCSGLRAADKPALTKKLEALAEPPGFTGGQPGGPSRWSRGRDTSWQPLRPELVVEVEYDHASGGRFRHGTKLLRWRPDKAPRQCGMEQMRAPRRGAPGSGSGASRSRSRRPAATG